MSLLTFSSFAQDRNYKEPYMTKSLPGLAIKNVTVETSGGSISVSGAASDARVEVYVSQNNSAGDLAKDEIQKRLSEDYNLNVTVDNNSVTAVARQKNRNMNWKKALNISFRVFVPGKVSTDLSTSGGSISLNDLSGAQNFSTSGGSLHVKNLSGSIRGRTSGGSIHLDNSNDEIDLQTSGGSIEASNCTGNITLETSGGTLKLNNLKGKIRANTSGGNVKAESISGELISHTSGGNIDLQRLSCSLETSTSGGNIDVSVKEFGKYLTISNSGGNIDLEIPGNKGVELRLAANKIKTDDLHNFNGRAGDDEVKGTLNGGGVPVTVSTSSGRIHLSFN